jgi:cation diffusion facilitator family transporter
VVNLVAAVTALWALTLAARPPDEEHAFGHNKAEYFSSGLESALILIAAGWIAATAVPRLFEPEPLQNIGVGLAVTLVAAAINGGVALVILRAGRRLRSITLEADARHLLTDVWTSVGVVLGIVLVGLTGWLALDPLIALIVAANIVWTGVRLLRDTGQGLLDRALPAEDQVKIQEIEHDIARDLPKSTFFIHVEPSEDPASFADQALDRERSEGPGTQKEGRTG